MNLTKNLLVHHHQILKRPNDNLPTGQYRTTMFLKFSDHVLTKCFKFIIQTMKQPPSSRPFSIRIQNCAVQLSPLILPLYRSSASSGRYAPIGPCRCCRTQQGAAGAGRLHLSLIDMRGAFASVDGVCCSSLERGLQLSLILIRGFFLLTTGSLAVRSSSGCNGVLSKFAAFALRPRAGCNGVLWILAAVVLPLAILPPPLFRRLDQPWVHRPPHLAQPHAPPPL